MVANADAPVQVQFCQVADCIETEYVGVLRLREIKCLHQQVAQRSTKPLMRGNADLPDLRTLRDE